MKGVYCTVFVALLVSFVTAQAPTCQDGVQFYPHPTDCTKFYTCSDGVAYELSCQPGLEWNDALSYCDYPETSGCTVGGSSTASSSVGTESTTGGTGSSTLPTEPPTTTIPPTTIAPSTVPPGGLPDSCPAVEDPLQVVRLPHAYICEYYYLCQQGEPVLYTCSIGSHFSPTSRICRPYNAAGCDRCPEVEVAGEEIRLPHNSDCRRYYVCVNTLPKLYQCSLDWQFSKTKRECMTVDEAKCRPVLS